MTINRMYENYYFNDLVGMHRWTAQGNDINLIFQRSSLLTVQVVLCSKTETVFARVWWVESGLPPQQATNEWLRTQLLMCSAAAVKATLLTSHWVPGKSWWEIDCEPCLGLAGCPSVIISWAAARGLCCWIQMFLHYQLDSTHACYSASLASYWDGGVE